VLYYLWEKERLFIMRRAQMKKLILLVCLLALLLSLPGVAAATPPVDKRFFLKGDTIGGSDPVYLPSGQMKYYLIAAGEVTGDFTGKFEFEEWGISHPDGSGNNRKLVTITSGDSSMIIRTQGQSQITGYEYVDGLGWLPVGWVKGTFTVLRADGDWAGYHHGQGTYSGDLRVFGFTVQYDGQFH
jgi:hypothetical protein